MSEIDGNINDLRAIDLRAPNCISKIDIGEFS